MGAQRIARLGASPTATVMIHKTQVGRSSMAYSPPSNWHPTRLRTRGLRNC
jgi:hypothetical protein